MIKRTPLGRQHTGTSWSAGVIELAQILLHALASLPDRLTALLTALMTGVLEFRETREEIITKKWKGSYLPFLYGRLPPES